MPSPSMLRRGALLLWCLGSIPGLSHAVVDEVPSVVIESIAAREYHAGDTTDGLQAPNRAQGFRTWFRTDGIALTERDASAEPLLQLRLVQWGRNDQLQAPAPGILVADDARVERRGADLTEWYINRPEGLEHGFDVAVAPPGAGALEFHLDSDRPARQVHADLIEFDSGERTLSYSKLKVWDANGTILPAHMQLQGSQRVVIQVDDAGALYPITVDPLLQRTADIVRNSAQSGAEFGIRIANAGDVNNDGIEDLVVGAFRWDDGFVDNGAAFVYLGPGFTNSTFLTVQQGGASFGAGVGGAGDLNNDGFDDVVIGAPGFDGTAGSNSGAAYVYFGGSGAFNPVVDVTMLGPQQTANMGASARGVGDVNGDGIDDLAIGVPRYNSAGRPDQGAAFVYYGGANFDNTVDALLSIPDVSLNIGSSLASGDVNGDGFRDVIVGAAGYESSGALVDEGAALLFIGGSGPIDTTADAILRSGRAGANGGASVAVGDFNGDGIDDVLSGAPLSSVVDTGAGMAQLWYGGTGSFDTLVDVTLFGSVAGEDFGRSVAALPDFTGDGRAEILAGAPRANTAGGARTGAVNLYFSSPSGFSSTPTLVLEGTQTDAAFGTTVAVGRFNSDTAFDVGVGEPARDISPGTNNGAYYLYFGQRNEVFSDSFEVGAPLLVE